MNAERLLQHFEVLAEAPDAIPRLRRFILDLAVRGKLVEQDPSDEPTSELLKRIQVEKARLIKEGIISKQKPASLTRQNWLSFESPVKWETVNFGDVCNLVTSGSRGWAEYYSDTGPKFIRAQNIRFGKLLLDDLACVSLPSKTEGTRTQLSQGDI